MLECKKISENIVYLLFSLTSWQTYLIGKNTLQPSLRLMPYAHTFKYPNLLHSSRCQRVNQSSPVSSLVTSALWSCRCPLWRTSPHLVLLQWPQDGHCGPGQTTLTSFEGGPTASTAEWKRSDLVSDIWQHASLHSEPCCTSLPWEWYTNAEQK